MPSTEVATFTFGFNNIFASIITFSESEEMELLSRIYYLLSKNI